MANAYPFSMRKHLGHIKEKIELLDWVLGEAENGVSADGEDVVMDQEKYESLHEQCKALEDIVQGRYGGYDPPHYVAWLPGPVHGHAKAAVESLGYSMK